jgi:hypothetical protein
MTDFRQKIMLNILMLFLEVAQVTQVLRRLGRILVLNGATVRTATYDVGGVIAGEKAGCQT